VLSRSLICTNPTEFSEARVVTFLNPYSFLQIHQSDVDLGKFDKICIDGIALKIFLDKVFGGTNIDRMSFDFTSVAHLVFQNAAAKSEHGFILGSDQESNDTFLARVSDMFQGITLDGHSGYFDNHAALSDYVEELAKSDYDFVVIGMGAVKQEEVAIQLKESGFKGRIYTCGGFIHQTALNGGEYYPAWVDKLNLRFAYRMFKEPSTIKRYLLDYPKSFFLLARNIKKFEH